MKKTNLDRVNEYFKEHRLFSETYKIAAKEILDRYQKEQLNIGIVTNRTCVTCLYCQTNPSSEFKHDRHKCTLVKSFVNIANATTHVCNDWTEIPF